MGRGFLVVYTIGLYVYSLATSCNLYLSIKPSTLYFIEKIRLHPTSSFSLSKSTISRVSFFFRTFASSSIAFFHLGSTRASSTFFGIAFEFMREKCLISPRNPMKRNKIWQMVFGATPNTLMNCYRNIKNSIKEKSRNWSKIGRITIGFRGYRNHTFIWSWWLVLL